jgi:DNA-binding NarL/FixJ family response regulator
MTTHASHPRDSDETLLFIIEYGVYPELIRALQQSRFTVQIEHQMRKAISFLKKQKPAVVVAEFYHEPAFRDRVSNLESMLAHLQRKLPETRIIVLYNREDEPFLQQVMGRFPVDVTLPLPVTPEELLNTLYSSVEST